MKNVLINVGREINIFEMFEYVFNMFESYKRFLVSVEETNFSASRELSY